jgi:2-oxoisovalerate dehydrogenase E2 component (dihydrolipoyl transacylase)
MGLGRAQVLPRMAPDGVGVVPAHVLGVSLGADHRVVDGAALAGFLRAWKALVEDPAQMLLSMR